MLKSLIKYLVLALLTFSVNLKASTILDAIISEIQDPQRSAASKDALPALPENNPDLTLGYVVLCSGTAIISDVLELSTVSQWSHMAMVFCDKKDIVLPSDSIAKKLSDIDKTNWLCLEENIDLGNNVHLVPWDTFYKNEDVASAVVLRPFIYDIGAMPTLEKLKTTNQHIGKSYERFISELVLSTFRANVTQDSKSLFCSELAALVLQDLGLLTKNRLSPDFRFADNFVPADFSTERPHALSLIGAQLGDELPAKEPNKGAARRAFESFTHALHCFLENACCCRCLK